MFFVKLGECEDGKLSAASKAGANALECLPYTPIVLNVLAFEDGTDEVDSKGGHGRFVGKVQPKLGRYASDDEVMHQTWIELLDIECVNDNGVVPLW